MPLLTPWAKILVCIDKDSYERHLFITDKWSIRSALKYADELFFKPLYIVNIWRKS